MGDMKYFYKDKDITDKINNRIDYLLTFIVNNEKITSEEADKKIKGTNIFKKIIDVDSFYWTLCSDTICNEYLSEVR